jgi:hypothetical protein
MDEEDVEQKVTKETKSVMQVRLPSLPSFPSVHTNRGKPDVAKSFLIAENRGALAQALNQPHQP